MSNRPAATSSSSSRRRSTNSTRSLDSTRMRLPGNSAAASCSKPLHARPDRDERIGRLALRALRRRRHREAAVMADEPPLEAVIDQPGVAVRTGEAVAALPAERERRIAAAVEKQQRLFAALDRGLHGLGEPRRDEASARRTFGAQVDRLDARQMLAAEPLRQMNARVAAAPRIHLGFDRRRRRHQHDRDLGGPRPHHRHVARVVAHAVLLLVGGVVLLIDDDQTEVCVRQKQRRARADHDADFVRRHRQPGARAQPRRELRMPLRRPGAEAGGEAIEELRRQRDLGHQHERLLAPADALGHRLEIHLGLARAGDAIEQGDAEAAAEHLAAQFIRGGALRRNEVGRRKVRVGRPRDGLGRQHQGFKRPLVDEAVDHAGRHAGLLRHVAFPPRQAVGQDREHPLTGRGHARRRRSGKAHADPLARRTEMFAHAQRHPQHHAARRQRIVRDPVDESA